MVGAADEEYARSCDVLAAETAVRAPRRDRAGLHRIVSDRWTLRAAYRRRGAAESRMPRLQPLSFRDFSRVLGSHGAGRGNPDAYAAGGDRGTRARGQGIGLQSGDAGRPRRAPDSIRRTKGAGTGPLFVL